MELRGFALLLTATAMGLQPEAAEWFRRATAGHERGELTVAIQSYEEALKRRQDRTVAHSNLGAALAQNGQVEESLDGFQTVVAQNASDRTSDRNLAQALLQASGNADATRELDRLVRLRPQDRDISILFANRYLSQGNYKALFFLADGTFTDVTEKARVVGSGWSTSADRFDYDNDGKLDLFVASFVEYSATKCGDNGLKTRYYCVPRPFEGRPSLLYQNNGDGTFTGMCRHAGIGTVAGKSHGVVATDVDIDGLMGLWVGYDTVSNFLFANRGDKFEEIALAAGVAYAANGQARSGMGADSADYDNDGYQDLFAANIDRERFSIYRNDGRGAWGLKFFDYDNDGNVDLLLANGHPDDMIEKTVSWAEPLLLFCNDGRSWANVSAQGGPAFSKSFPARGLAVGDFDNDGALDVLISNNGAAPLLLRNRHGARNNWLGLRLSGTVANRDAIGVKVTWSFGGVKRSRLKTSGGSFLSSHDSRMILGIGQAKRIDWIEIRWPLPSRLIERLTTLPLNRYLTVVEGKGIVAESA